MNQRGKDVLEKIKGKLIVSCQARVGWPMYGADIMAAFAAAAEQGGAAGIRATGVDNITRIREKVHLPIIGINKQFRARRIFWKRERKLSRWTLRPGDGRAAKHRKKF